MSGQNNSLPQGWTGTSLGEIVQPTRPRHSPKDYPSLPFIGMENVEAHTMRLLGTVPASTMRSSAVHFLPGDVLYGRLRPYLNKVLCPDLEGLCSAEFIVFPKSENLDSKFIQYLFNSTDFVSFASHLNAGDRPRVDFEQVSSYRVPLPPLTEQSRIVAEIEKQFTRLDVAVGALKRVHANLKRYRAAVLKAACEGRLVPTEAELACREGRSYEPASELLKRILAERRARWEAAQLAKFGASDKSLKDDKWKQSYPESERLNTAGLSSLPIGWAWTNVDELSVVVRGASPRPAGDPKYFGGSIPWITVGALTRDEQAFLRAVNETVTEAGREASRYIEPDTLLLTNSGATLGVPKITLIGGCINDGSVALLFVDYPTKLYLYYFLKSQTRSLRAINQGAAQPNLNTKIVRAIIVPLPPLAEQQRIIDELQLRVSVIEELEMQVEASLKRADRLRQAILKRAFEGKLVPQDPTDEPASAVLDRIRVERAHREAERKPSGKALRKPRNKKEVASV